MCAYVDSCGFAFLCVLFSPIICVILTCYFWYPSSLRLSTSLEHPRLSCSLRPKYLRNLAWMLCPSTHFWNKLIIKQICKFVTQTCFHSRIPSLNRKEEYGSKPSSSFFFSIYLLLHHYLCLTGPPECGPWRIFNAAKHGCMNPKLSWWMTTMALRIDTLSIVILYVPMRALVAGSVVVGGAFFFTLSSCDTCICLSPSLYQ